MSDTFKPYHGMDVDDEWIPEDLLSTFLSRMPQVCVDLVVETDEGLLLAKRDIHPPVWFWPGSRLYKGERLREAAHRIADGELGIDADIIDRYGPYAHFWADSAVQGSPSRHTVNPVFHVEPAREAYEITLDEQHAEYRFLTELEPDLHEYVRLYIEDNDLL